MTATPARAPLPFAAAVLTEEDVEAVVHVLRSGWLTTGAVTRDFESALADHTGTRHVVATSSCTTALECAVASLRLPPGARVAVPAWTFVSTVTVLLRLGLEPVLLDVEADTLNASADSLRRAVAQGVSAAVLVHFAGAPVDAEVVAFACSAGLPVVEDCAHALGARLQQPSVTRARCYSFYATKNLTTAEGGALATDDDEVADFARRYRLHGMSADAWRRYEPGASSAYDVSVVGVKGNLPDLLAALGLSQLRRFPSAQQRRRELVRHYRSLLAAGPTGLRLLRADEASADHLVVVVLPPGTDRRAVEAEMAARGIGVSVHFTPVHHFSGLRALVDTSCGLPVTELMAGRVLSLPLHAGMELSDVDRVVCTLAEALAVSSRPAPARCAERG